MQALKESGFVEGKNMAIESRWANDDYDRLPEMAADLVRTRVALIVAIGNSLPATPIFGVRGRATAAFGYCRCRGFVAVAHGIRWPGTADRCGAAMRQQTGVVLSENSIRLGDWRYTSES